MFVLPRGCVFAIEKCKKAGVKRTLTVKRAKATKTVFVLYKRHNSMFLMLRLIIVAYCGRFYLHGLTLIPAWISNYIHYKLWDEITYPFP